MSRLGAKTYSRRNECKTSVQFDHLLAEKGNKPSTAKVSVAAVHRWGMTSFTSLRKTHLNGQNDLPSDGIEPVKRFKKESIRAPVVAPSKDPFNFDTGVELSSVDGFLNKHNSETTDVKPKKFFKSSERSSKKRLTATADSSRKMNVEAPLGFPVLQNYSVSKVEDGLNADGRITKNQCESMDNNTKSLQGYVCVDSVRLVGDQNPPECVALSVKLDPLKPVNCLKVEQRSAVHELSMLEAEYTQQTCDTNSKPTSFDISGSINIVNSVISDITETSVKTLDYVPSWDNTETYSTEKWENLAALHDVQISSDSVANVEINADSGTVSIPTRISGGENNVKNERGDVNCPELFDKEQTIKSKNIFRSKKIFNSSKKPKAVYNHRHWQSFREENFGLLVKEPEKDEASAETTVLVQQHEENFQKMNEALNSEIHLHPNQPGEQLYEVVGNVKQAYQVHESGEAQEFNDDIEYLLDGLQNSNGIGTRCLSALGLATKCMGPAFRIHLRAHGTMPKIFSALQDAPADPNLSLCTATLLFVLSQDRLTMDIDASTLSMMLQLLETDPESGNPDRDVDLILEDPSLCAMQEKHREKIYQLCEQMKLKGHAKHLRLDSINASILAMEALLSLTSRKAGEWFKEEIRTLRGLDRIVDTVASSVDALACGQENDTISHLDEVQLEKIQKIDRCLRVLENVTYMNFENQDYLLHYKEALISSCCLSLIKLCKSSLLKYQDNELRSCTIPSDETQKNMLAPILFCLLSVMKVLLNITFENSLACSRIGSENGLIENVLMCIFQVPRAVPNEKRFDLLVLSLGLMINLVEHCCENRRRLMETISLGSFDTINDGYEIPASEGLVEVLHSRLEAARKSEEQADELLNSADVLPTVEKKDSESQAECLEETLMKTLQKAGKHMEHSIIAAYISLLLGCVMQNNQEYVNIIRDYTPEGKFDAMIDVLKKFMSFVSLTGSVGSTGVNSIQRIIEVFNNNR